jgi:EAL domain-containing protein (putative c-di-GMP-specific phosphodiesterase class I)/GGDEF domain-containing protein
LRVLLRVADGVLRAAAIDALSELQSESVAEDGAPDVVFAEIANAEALDAALSTTHSLNAALVAALPPDAHIPAELLARVQEWLRVPASVADIRERLVAAEARNAFATRGGPADDLVRFRDLLFDHRTGLPTLPVMIEHARDLLDRRGQLTVLFIHFVWYEKIEENFGWQKLDEVLETTAAAVRSFYGAATPAESIIMVSHVADDDFILFTHTPAPPERAERALRDISQRLEGDLRQAIEAVHGEDIATLCGIYVGASTVFRNARIRTERLIYRGIREASQAARGAEQWERSRMVNDLRTTIREGAVFFEYHPIIVTESQEIFGFEALARGIQRELRSPEVLFEVAEQANLVWELSRLLRQRAVEGIFDELTPGQCLFLNVDPHDFDDPAFRNLSAADLGIDDAGRVVLEITERTAIRDYPRFRDHLAAFRERGFRFAVDDAGSGYAGLGSIANLAPDFIKLDISLIANIDANLLKQGLVQTMVAFAENNGAQVVAEGVERPEEFETIRALGVHFTQGFLFHQLRYTGPPEPPGAPVSHAGMRRDNN